MLRALTVSLVLSSSILVAGCASDGSQGSGPGYDCESALQSILGTCSPSGGGGGGGGGGTPDPDAFDGKGAPTIGEQIAPHGGCPGASCPVAVGGTGLVTVVEHDGRSVGMTQEAGPATLTLFSASPTVQTFLIGATASGETDVSFTSTNFAPVPYTAVTKEVRDVRILPKDPYGAATMDPAFTWETLHVVAAILGDDDVWGERLVDSSLLTGLPSPSWDRFVLPPTLGAHTVTLQAKSFGVREIVVDVFDAIDSVDATVGAVENDGSRVVCFHAYLGAREVYVQWARTPSPEVTFEPETNCVRVLRDEPGTVSVTAVANARSHSVEVVFP